MNKADLQQRTKKFALDVIRLSRDLPRTQEFKVISTQLLRSAVSVGANYRSACRGKSAADFIAKMSIVEEEADESIYWLELLQALGISTGGVTRLEHEGNELVSIIVASKKTAKRAQLQ